MYTERVGALHNSYRILPGNLRTPTLLEGPHEELEQLPKDRYREDLGGILANRILSLRASAGPP